MKIVADAHIPFVKEYFGAYGDLILKAGREMTAKDVHDAEMLLVRSVTHVDEQLLKNSSVKFVGSVTAGADHLDTKWLDEAGILWCVATGFNAPPVADYVVSVVAALQRKRLLGTQNMSAAVIGVGNVGRLVVERLRLLHVDVTLCDPLRALNEKDFHSTALAKLADVDLISLHVPLTRSGDYPTYHFIEKNFLKRQKSGCVLLNASRGAVVNSEDLLRNGRHLQWAFDVWEGEPRINKTILEAACVATPHIAGYSIQSKIRGIDMIYRRARDKNIIPAQTFSPLCVPMQELGFAGDAHHWQDIILGVFNPVIMTAMMRSLLLPAAEYGSLFDEMRHQFNYRHEFSSTKIVDTSISLKDRETLKNLGLKFSPQVLA